MRGYITYVMFPPRANISAAAQVPWTTTMRSATAWRRRKPFAEMGWLDRIRSVVEAGEVAVQLAEHSLRFAAGQQVLHAHAIDQGDEGLGFVR